MPSHNIKALNEHQAHVLRVFTTFSWLRLHYGSPTTRLHPSQPYERPPDPSHCSSSSNSPTHSIPNPLFQHMLTSVLFISSPLCVSYLSSPNLSPPTHTQPPTTTTTTLPFPLFRTAYQRIPRKPLDDVMR